MMGPGGGRSTRCRRRSVARHLRGCWQPRVAAHAFAELRLPAAVGLSSSSACQVAAACYEKALFPSSSSFCSSVSTRVTICMLCGSTWVLSCGLVNGIV